MKPDVRDRLFLPIVVPVGILVVIALVAVAFGMLLYFNPMTVSLTIATVVSAAILGAFGLASSQSEADLTKAKRAVIALAGVLPLGVGALVATGIIDTADERVAERECHFCVPEDAVEVVAVNIAFDPNEITLPAEGEVSILFRNEDQNIPHNISIYPDEDDGPALDSPIFEGEIFNGVDQMVYTFEAPDETDGSFWFRCDVHPEMLGNAIFD